VLQLSCGERLESELRQAGFRVTPQRAVILESISHLKGHRSAQEVFDSAVARLPGLNIATVYRTLDTLHQAGIIDLFPAGPNSILFSLRDEANKHGHLLCRNCARVLKVDPAYFKALAETMRNTYAFKVDCEHLTLQGICEACRTELSED
jgi:Fur family ferric uptake transcriptional regulator